MERGGSHARPGGIYHFISRFVAQQWFIESAVERRMYLTLLGYAMEETDWRCFSYAVMSNHIHLGLVAGKKPMVDWLRPMHSAFATWINKRQERIGAVFVRGPKLIEFREHAVSQLVNYIHRNPVRAGVVAMPSDTDWTSQRAYAGTSYRPRWLDVEYATRVVGFDGSQSFAASIERNEIDRQVLEALEVNPRPKLGRPKRKDGAAPLADPQNLSPGLLDDPKMRNPPEQEAGFCW